MTKNDEFIKNQYNQCYECMRHHNSAIWKIPLLFFTLTGTVIFGAFHLTISSQVRILIFFFCSCVAYVLFLAMIKHHYYYEIELETLTKIEDHLNVKRIKRKTFVKDSSKYWATEYETEKNVPNFFVPFIKFFENQGSHIAFLVSSFLTFCIIIFLTIGEIIQYLI